jgi:hypothetical protein
MCGVLGNGKWENIYEDTKHKFRHIVVIQQV